MCAHRLLYQAQPGAAQQDQGTGCLLRPGQNPGTIICSRWFILGTNSSYGTCRLSIITCLFHSVADPGSRILIFIHPRSLSDPESWIQQQSIRGGGNFFCRTIFCNQKYQKILNYFIFELVKKFF